jgi:hypothetical protein
MAEREFKQKLLAVSDLFSTAKRHRCFGLICGIEVKQLFLDWQRRQFREP